MKIILTTIFIFIVLTPTWCQNKPVNSVTSKIDSLFKPWDNPNSPGAAVAVIKDGKVIFMKGYGMANLEYNQPITPSSIFHIASESKQFTAFCIVLLAKKGKLNLDDDIRKFLPYVPDFGKSVTIRHLIHHTSGIRDQFQLLTIGGQRMVDVIEQADIIKLVERQKELNFDPGSRHFYCNTGYTLLGEIVKKASGKSLREYADENIFKPLGMTNTHFHDDNREIVAGRTYSYESIDSGKFNNYPLNYATTGGTGLFTTVEDEAKWLNNYETGQVGGKKAIEQMFQLGTLNNGSKLTYAFGLVIDTLDGYRRIGHGGADAGYRTYAGRFPEEKLGIIVFSNLSQVYPYDLATKIAGFYLPNKTKGGKNPVYQADSSTFRAFRGSYYSKEGVLEVIDSSKLYIKLGELIKLTSLSDTSFSWNSYAVITFVKNGKGEVNKFKLKTWQEQEERIYTRFVKTELTEADRSAIVGTYESEELEARYHIVSENGRLILRHRKYPDGTLEPITRNQFIASHWWMNNLTFTRNSNGIVDGFEVNGYAVLRLKFRKIKI